MVLPNLNANSSKPELWKDENEPSGQEFEWVENRYSVLTKLPKSAAEKRMANQFVSWLGPTVSRQIQFRGGSVIAAGKLTKQCGHATCGEHEAYLRLRPVLIS